MNKKDDSKQISKSFMTAGPTLHYSHNGVISFWLVVVFLFAGACLFWAKLMTGNFTPSDAQIISSFQSWDLGRFTVAPISIFEYPYHILVLGLLMGLLAITPLLVSQLMSFRYAIPLIFSVMFLANLPGLALTLIISCIAVACRPLRFRSRFISIALCTAPQLIYWGIFGGAKNLGPISWGFSFTPWVFAWLVALTSAAIVLGIGHYIRYRPGVVTAVTALTLLQAFFIFDFAIGFDELDYQLYIANNNPENCRQFRDNSITELLDRTITNPAPQVKKYVDEFFFPRDSIPRRKRLKQEIIEELQIHDRWPWWFNVPQKLQYKQKRNELFAQYDIFINRRQASKRMPIAIYYKAKLSEFSPDIKLLEQKEILHFYSDYPHQTSEGLWRQLYSQFPDSPESLEARWRIARRYAAHGYFELAREFISEAQKLITELLQENESQTEEQKFFTQFHSPPDTVMTSYKLIELQRKINEFQILISDENRTEDSASAERLAKFVALNPHNPDYELNIEQMLAKMAKSDPLYDNLLLAKTKLIDDLQLRAEKMLELHENFKGTDAGIEALYNLSFLRKDFWLQQEGADLEQKKKYLANTRETLKTFIKLYPKSIYAEQVLKNLEVLPSTN